LWVESHFEEILDKNRTRKTKITEYCRNILIYGQKMNVYGIKLKKLSLCNKLWLYNPYIFWNQSRRPEIFQTVNSVWSNDLSLKYQKFKSSDWKDIGIRNFWYVAKTQFLCNTKTFFLPLTGLIMNVLGIFRRICPHTF